MLAGWSAGSIFSRSTAGPATVYMCMYLPFVHGGFGTARSTPTPTPAGSVASETDMYTSLLKEAPIADLLKRKSSVACPQAGCKAPAFSMGQLVDDKDMVKQIKKSLARN